LVSKQRLDFGETAFAEVSIFEVPSPKSPSLHLYKYRLAYVVDGECVLRYDNEFGKGDHKHIGELEFIYEFIDLNKLLDDFYSNIKRWNDENTNP